MKQWKTIKFICLIFLGLVLGGCNNDEGLVQKQNMRQIEIKGQELMVEVADTTQLRYQGLSGRQNMGRDEGMLFVFDSYTMASFVMREMNFPLDIIWIRDDKVVGCSQNLPAPAPGESPALATPAEKVNYVVEVNAGWCEEKGIEEGDDFRIV